MRRDHLIGYLLIIPALLAIFAVIIYPMITAFDMSLHKIILTQPKLGRPFIGLENYREVMTGPVFMNAVKNTVVWTGVNLVVQMVLGTLIALLLSESFPGRAMARGAMLIPWVTPSVVAVLSWRWMYDAQFGIINDILVKLGIIEKGIAWLGNTNTAMAAVLLESIWKGTPFVMIMILAALQAVPKELYDAAWVDGADRLKTFFNITLPLIMPTLTIAATLTTIYTFNNFNAIWLMTEGGPLRATETLTILVYTRGFRDFNLGQASAIGVITLLILLVFVVLFGRRYIRSEIEW
ncbi:MAG: sugar ABC transporter permease [Chloroflexi bacterium]|nr:sugar ABC transporter permease [Chloroflexota bacterium]